MAEEEDSGKVFFPLGLVPAADHATVAALGSGVRRKLLIHSLHVYLEFTADLEQSIVNPVTHQISRQRLGVELPPEMEEDAYKIYVDEAWHSRFSDDLQRQIECATEVPRVRCSYPVFMERLAHIEHRLRGPDRHMARIFFAIISETLISSFLAKIPSDASVVQPVRDMVSDHAVDEGRHHAYFSQLLRWLWPALNGRERALIGDLLPEFIHAFLEPDVRAVTTMLVDCGLDRQQIEEVVLDVYKDWDKSGIIEISARHTVKHLAEVGVFADSKTRESFQEAGLLGQL
ncbi:MAG TPA: diiron oxygenase [Solirubrobacterales bacterium]|nr:diiron oxygenase [Solirubrobacterales bacterium]